MNWGPHCGEKGGGNLFATVTTREANGEKGLVESDKKGNPKNQRASRQKRVKRERVGENS